MVNPPVALLRVVPCTWCGAEPNDSCVRPDGSKLRGIVHGPRWDVYLARTAKPGDAMVLVGGPGAGQLAPAERDIWRVPMRGDRLYAEYHRHRIIAGPNIWCVGVQSRLIWPSDIAQTIEAYAALLGLTAEDRERCLVARLAEPGPGQVDHADPT